MIIDAVKLFAKNLPGLINAVKEVKKVNLTAETRRDVDGILKYTFEQILVRSNSLEMV